MVVGEGVVRQVTLTPDELALSACLGSYSFVSYHLLENGRPSPAPPWLSTAPTSLSSRP